MTVFLLLLGYRFGTGLAHTAVVANTTAQGQPLHLALETNFAILEEPRQADPVNAVVRKDGRFDELRAASLILCKGDRAIAIVV